MYKHSYHTQRGRPAECYLSTPWSKMPLYCFLNNSVKREQILLFFCGIELGEYSTQAGDKSSKCSHCSLHLEKFKKVISSNKSLEHSQLQLMKLSQHEIAYILVTCR